MHGGGRSAAVGFAVLLLFAGCLGESGGDEEDQPEGTDPVPWTLDTSVRDCLEVIGAVLEDPAALARHLPEGFTPRDSSDFFGLPVPSGRGLVFFNALDCADGTQPSAEIAIFAHAPTLANQSAVDYDLYTLVYGTASEEKLAALGGYDYVTAIEMEAVLSQETPLGVLASGGVAGQSGSGMDYSFEVASGAPQDYTLSARFWRVVPDGYVHVDYRLDGVTGYGGVITDCSMSGVLATLVGANSCTGEQALGLVFPAQTYEGTIHFVPHP